MMDHARDDTSVAYTYAWWLTGDEAAAGDAVRTAFASPGLAGAHGDARLAVLLAEVRSAAAPAPTMCPASEIALLHDAHRVPLDDAGKLAGVDAADVRTELAHGRIEALTQTVIDPFVHPERLGGLAVANPADVAHARQCVSCGHARMLLERGREELRELAVVPVPPDLKPSRPRVLAGSRRVATLVALAAAAVVLAVVAVLAFTGG